MTTVEDILMVKGPDVIVAAPTNTALDAAKMMAEANVGSVIVRDNGSLEGIFTERDLLRRVVAAGKDPSSVRLGEVMSSPVKSCRLGDDIQECAKELSEGHIRHIAVVEQGSLVGLVGLRDVLTTQLQSTQKKVHSLCTQGGKVQAGQDREQ